MAGPKTEKEKSLAYPIKYMKYDGNPGIIIEDQHIAYLYRDPEIDPRNGGWYRADAALVTASIISKEEFDEWKTAPFTKQISDAIVGHF